MTAITDIRMPAACCAELSRRGFDIIPLPPFPQLPTPVASHPDMLIFIRNGVLLTHRDYYLLAQKELDRIASVAGLNLVLSDETVADKYPRDVLFNVACVGTHILGRKDAVSHHILKICSDTSSKFVDMRQGYAKCSTCIVDDNTIITADTGIADAARKHGINTLKITPGHVRLDGYDTGFIGGASGCCGNTVYFCGNIDWHPDAVAIRTFCTEHGKNVVSLGDGDLLDVGTIFFL
ncbi:MAG: hypothetical protein IJY27_02750 [Clostridia bacterium]|nr:hypothetical protein [Clostridia bacterium]